jgi:hypothetical protein
LQQCQQLKQSALSSCIWDAVVLRLGGDCLRGGPSKIFQNCGSTVGGFRPNPMPNCAQPNIGSTWSPGPDSAKLKELVATNWDVQTRFHATFYMARDHTEGQSCGLIFEEWRSRLCRRLCMTLPMRTATRLPVRWTLQRTVGLGKDTWIYLQIAGVYVGLPSMWNINSTR